MGPYIVDPRWGPRPAHDASVKELFGLRREAKWPVEGMPEREIQGIRCRVDPLVEGPFKLRARAICPICGMDLPIGRLEQHAKVHA